MSFSQTNTSAARTRPLRAQSNAAKSTTLSSTAHNPVISSSAQIPSTTSNLALFITNLRLLGLDDDPEWPGITTATFSTKDASGGQKKRIHCVEWSLFQLFLLWDQDEAQSKLSPYFPPLDQVMSINLRAALTRLLEQAKKTGVLGRDAVVRKTMLDECRGERLEEVLAVFSSAVLKKLVAERSLNGGLEYRLSVSEQLALENWGYSGERTELNGLILAHKVSLTSHLAKKKAARDRYRDFEELLALKERGLTRRQEEAKLRQPYQIQTSDAVKSAIGRTVKMNWTGNEQWTEGILYDNTSPRKGGLLGTPFDEVWNGVRGGRISDLEEQSAGLLEQLDQRVGVQRSRLDRWHGFREKMFAQQPNEPVSSKRPEIPKTNATLRFTAHKSLSLQDIDLKTSSRSGPLEAPTEYSQLMASMQTELEKLTTPQTPDISQLLTSAPASGGRGQRLVVPMSTTELTSDLSEWEDEQEEEPLPAPPPKKPSLMRNPSSAGNRFGSAVPRRNQHGKAPSVDEWRARSRTGPPLKASEAAHTSGAHPPKPATPPLAASSPQATHEPPALSDPSPETTATVDATAQSESSALHTTIPPEPTPEPSSKITPEKSSVNMDTSPEEFMSPTQALADQILASVTNASPSPTKSKYPENKPRQMLSLAERTRMSLSRGGRTSFMDDGADSSDNYEDFRHAPPTSRGTNSQLPRESTIPEVEGLADASVVEHEDLVARTRRSMAGFEAARQKAQLERRRSQRKSRMMSSSRKDSFFPRVAEEDNAGEASVIDELMDEGQEADYEAIFRSRPRIAASPVPSPTRELKTLEADDGADNY